NVPGFMIGTKDEKQGIIRHGAKLLVLMSEATVPKISVIVRKAYGAVLYVMTGPGFEPDCCLALRSVQIVVMGPEAAVNAVYANKIAELDEDEREQFINEKQKEYKEEIDMYRLASEMIVDDIVEPDKRREALATRFKVYNQKPI